MFKAWADHAAVLEKKADTIIRQRPEPLRKSIGTSLLSGTGPSTVTLDLGGPAAGRMWFVHRVGILGADGHTAVAGAIADIYTGPALGTDATSEIYAGLSVPSIVVEGRHHNPVLYGDGLYVIVYNVPTNQLLQFTAGIEDYPAPDQLAMSIK